MGQDERKLPSAIGDTLSTNVRDALEHPLRRRILRLLNLASASQTAVDLCEAISDFRISIITYHLAVLERDSCVSVAAEIVHGRGDALRAYVSNIKDDRSAMGALAAMRSEDERLA